MGSWDGDHGGIEVGWWKRLDGWGQEFLQFLEDHFEPRIYLQGRTFFSPWFQAWNHETSFWVFVIFLDVFFLNRWNKKCIGSGAFSPVFRHDRVCSQWFGSSARSQLVCLLGRSPSDSSWSTSMKRYDHGVLDHFVSMSGKTICDFELPAGTRVMHVLTHGALSTLSEDEPWITASLPNELFVTRQKAEKAMDWGYPPPMLHFNAWVPYSSPFT